MMNINEINKRIKQRPPFQMIDRVLELEEGEYAKGIKCVSVNEQYFLGHFPDSPVMPGMLTIESAAQLCSIAATGDTMNPDKLYMLLRVKDFKFLLPIIPGDVMNIEVRKLRATAGSFSFSVEISVDEKKAAKGELLFAAVDKNNVYRGN